MQLSDSQITILEKIINDRESGASQLARVALWELADFARSGEWKNSQLMLDDIRGLATHLGTSRPSMAPLENMMKSFVKHVSLKESVQELRQSILDSAAALVKQSEQAVEQSVDYLCALLKDKSVFMTHSSSSTIKLFLQKNRPAIEHLVCTLSGPGNEGKELAYWTAQQGIATTLITDAQPGLFMDQVQAVIVGADAILSDGTVINKSGTFLLALAARQKAIPFYVCCERFKMVDRLPKDFPLEEKSAGELETITHKNLTIRNIIFDRTPASLITALVTDSGIQNMNPREKIK